MYCSNCGTKVSDTSKFCGSCGSALNPKIEEKVEEPVKTEEKVEKAEEPVKTEEKPKRTRKKSTNIETNHMICKKCNGEMDIDKKKEILVCPFCGSKQIIMESDEIKIQKIKSETEQKIELARIRKEKKEADDRIAMMIIICSGVGSTIIGALIVIAEILERL